MINCAQIFTSDAIGSNMDKTKNGPFHKDFAVDMNFCGILCIIYLEEIKFGCMQNHPPRSRTGNMSSFSSITPIWVCSMSLKWPTNLRSIYVASTMKTFQKYLTLHKGQHIIADGLMEYGYSGVDENSKVRVITNSINTNALNACNAAILDIP